jgi:hypothetical protein
VPTIDYSSAEIMGMLVDIIGHQTTLQQQLAALLQQESRMANNLDVIQTKIDALKADVAAGKTVSDSAVTLINGLAAQNASYVQQLKDLVAANGSPAQFAAIVADMDATNAAMDADRKALGDAIAANTAA